MQTKNIIQYAESAQKTHEYIREIAGHPLPDDVKKHVLAYLNNAEFISAGVVKTVVNAFTNEPMSEVTGTWMSDGQWHWQDFIFVYVRDYDIELPEAFVDTVEKFFENGGETRPRRNPEIALKMFQNEGYKERYLQKNEERKKLRAQGVSTADIMEKFFDEETERFLNEYPEYSSAR